MSTRIVDPAGHGTFGRFPFGLTDEQEARARHLHQHSTIVDMVHQGAGSHRLFELPGFEAAAQRLSQRFPEPLAFMAAALRASAAADAVGGDVLRRCWQQSGVTSGYLYVDVGPEASSPGAGLAAAGRELLRSLPWLRLAVTAEQVRRAKADGVHALVGYCQPVYGLPEGLEHLDRAYAAGLRVLMLTYNARDRVGAGCTAEVDEGLTPFGREVVAWCNGNRVIVDTSHCGPATTLDACRWSRAPVIANHSSAAGLYPHPRGKSDEAIRAIAASGGLVGVVAVPFFLAGQRNASIEVMLDHIDYIARLVGWRHVGIGTDWPLTGPKAGLAANFGATGLAQIGFDEQRHQIDATRNLVGFDDYRDFPNITRGLVARGHSDEAIRGILGENFLRVFAEVAGGPA